MKRIKEVITRFPLVFYIIITFTVSWSLLLVVIGGPGRILVPNEEALPLVPLAIVAMLPGPALAGVLATLLVSGRAGFREFFSRLRIWRAGIPSYAAALLTAPLIASTILFVLLQFSPEYLPAIAASDDKVFFILIGITAGLLVGLFEEIGWTGFALPWLRRRYGVVSSGLILGFMWGAWHYILALWGSGTAGGDLVLGRFLPEMLFYVAVLPVYRVLMAWLYEHTGSLLLAVLMHAMLTGIVPNILMPPAITGSGLTIWYLIMAAVLWFFVGLASRANGGQLAAHTSGEQAV